MTLDAPLDNILAVARHMRENNDHFIPTIVWQPHNGESVIATLTPINDNDDDEDGTDLDAVFHELRTVIGDPEWFTISLDAYARDDDTPGTPAEPPAPGELEAAFAAGDMTVVEELVTIHVEMHSRTLTMYRQIYRYTPVDGWEWEDPEIVESPDDAVVTAVRMFH
jgi:hypothetical protein